MGLSVITANTTTKLATMPRGSVSTNGSQQTLFQTPANTRYKIWAIVFSVDPATSRHLELFDASAAPTITARLITSMAGQIQKFDPPLELSNGQGLIFNGNSVGAYSANWTLIGENLINSP